MTRASHENNESGAPEPCKGATAPKTNAEPPEKIDRDTLLGISSALVTTLDRRLRSRVFRSSKHDKVRLSYARALTAAVTAHDTVLKNAEITDLERRIAALEEQKERESPNRWR